MIKGLSIKNLAVIEDCTVDLDSPYVALLGETGAGKSLIVDSLSLLQGAKADKGLIRNGEKEAKVSALFHIDEKELLPHPSLKEVVDEEGNILLGRTVSQEGSSKCMLNGGLCSLKELREVGSLLIDIHSQGENSTIADEKKALSYIDAFLPKEINPILSAYKETYSAWLSARSQKEEFLKEREDMDVDYLHFQIDEIERMHLKENEIEDLEKESQDLKGMERLRESYERLLEEGRLAEGDLLEILSSYLSKLRPFASSPLADLSQKAYDAGRDFLNAMEELQESYRQMDADPGRIDYINERLFSLKGLQRKYGKATADILSVLKEDKEKLSRIADFEGEKARLEKEEQKAKEACQKVAEKLTLAREKSAKALSSRIGKEMEDLGLPKDGFSVNFKKREIGPDGQDEALFMVKLNKGLPEAELKKVASGGESSRLMLALKAVLNHLFPADVLVLDEIDTGISGKAASLVARKIQALQKDSQVLVVSHLAQVVASSQDALEVEKKTKDGKTIVVTRRLDSQMKEKAIARMISGREVTAAALAQAKALIEEYR